jgi:hypothetical protein
MNSNRNSTQRLPMDHEQTKADIVRFLQRIGVDTRFISIVDNHLFVNNQRFSRFSNKRQETFNGKFPSISIKRSKIFQRICTRASRVLANALKPGERIFILDSDKCSRFILEVIMEPYTRKYGIKLVYGNSFDDVVELGANSIALPVTLDSEVDYILDRILNGEKIEVLSLKNRFNKENDPKYIYPFINVPRSWIVSWFEKFGYAHNFAHEESYSVDMLEFFEGFIPDVRENVLKSAVYVVDECVYNDKKNDSLIIKN